jgi:hypothetical protein
VSGDAGAALPRPKRGLTKHGSLSRAMPRSANHDDGDGADVENSHASAVIRKARGLADVLNQGGDEGGRG